MKKLTLAAIVSATVSMSAFAGDDIDKIESSFASLDNDANGYISKEEADDDDIWNYFTKIDANADAKISVTEFNDYLAAHPSDFEKHVKRATMNAEHDMEDVKNAVADIKDTSDWGDDDDNTTASTSVKTTTSTQSSMTEKSVTDTAKDYGVQPESKTQSAMTASAEFNKLDTNHDGKLTLTETTDAKVKQDFSKIDQNGDDMITRMEYTTYMQTDKGMNEYK